MSSGKETNDVVKQELAAIRDCSQRMLEAATAGEWERVAEIEEVRKGVHVESLRDVGVGDVRREIEEELRTILEINKKILDMADLAKGQLLQQIRQVNVGKAATKAYQEE